ncbi:MAG: aspartate/glutamate racemase family protein [Coxiellaceae bacterium]|nr:aspartate/glutamate racemase family protein [Coxiellaceae bacterium]
MKKPLIGALVGMGPKSTATFYERVMHEATEQYGAKQDMDFPDLLMYSLPTPFVIGELIDEAIMKQQLSKGIGTLVKAGVQMIAVPCNVVHLYYDHMQQVAGDIPLLNMVELAVNAIDPNSAKRIALLATEPTIESELYQQGLINKAMQPFVSAELQLLVDQLIGLIKLHAVESDQVCRQWEKLIAYLSVRECDTALIACTDLSAAIEAYPHHAIRFIDAMHALAHAFVEQYSAMHH